MSRFSNVAEARADSLEQAAEWFAILNDDSVTRRQRDQWQGWLAASVTNREAWRRVERIDRQFRGVQAEPVRRALQAAEQGRRRFAAGLAGLVVAAPLAWSAWQLSSLSYSFADMRTLVGEVREAELPDGGHLWLNTGTALTLDYDTKQRLVTLRQGEVFIETATDERPFRVKTANGYAAPLGTRFGVRVKDDQTRVSVIAGKVAVTPRLRPEEQFIVRAGHSVCFDENQYLAHDVATAAEQAWQQGLLVADDMPLGDFLDQLTRYRPGVIRYDAEIARLRLGGSFAIDDTDRILSALEQTLPVKVARLTPWWVKVSRA